VGGAWESDQKGHQPSPEQEGEKKGGGGPDASDNTDR
jgi:hypothetical protein